MSGKANLVLWAGLLLVIVQAVSTGQWSEVWGPLSGKTTAVAATSGGTAAATGGLLSNAPGGITGVEQYLKSNPVSGAAKTAIKQILGII
jgi:hypothetical protein